jgi:hypothetical protein
MTLGSKGHNEDKLHIFVNRRKFTEEQGVAPTMTGAQIATLVDVPADIAIVRRGQDASAPDIGVTDPIEISQAEHFLVTRKIVEGGWSCR